MPSGPSDRHECSIMCWTEPLCHFLLWLRHYNVISVWARVKRLLVLRLSNSCLASVRTALAPFMCMTTNWLLSECLVIWYTASLCRAVIFLCYFSLLLEIRPVDTSQIISKGRTKISLSYHSCLTLRAKLFFIVPTKIEVIFNVNFRAGKYEIKCFKIWAKIKTQKASYSVKISVILTWAWSVILLESNITSNKYISKFQENTTEMAMSKENITGNSPNTPWRVWDLFSRFSKKNDVIFQLETFTFI